MNGIEKVLDELGFIILKKDIEIESQREEIAELKQKVELIESYLEVYDEFYSNVN